MESERSPAEEIRHLLRWLVVATVVLLLAAGLTGGWVIQRSAQQDADRLYADSVASCQRVNAVRTELDNLFTAFETHNSITGDLFSIVGESLVGDNPRAARAFTRFSVQYRAIASQYDNIEIINCPRAIEKP